MALHDSLVQGTPNLPMPYVGIDKRSVEGKDSAYRISQENKVVNLPHRSICKKSRV